MTYGDIHHLEPVGIADKVIGEDDGALEARVGPSRPAR